MRELDIHVAPIGRTRDVTGRSPWSSVDEELRQIAGGRDDVLAEAAGITAGSWYARPSTHLSAMS